LENFTSPMYFTVALLPFHVICWPSEVEPSAVFCLDGKYSISSAASAAATATGAATCGGGALGAARPASWAAWAKTPVPAGHSK